eukprot:365639-Chlamydomonas_euryale.AAC.4
MSNRRLRRQLPAFRIRRLARPAPRPIDDSQVQGHRARSELEPAGRPRLPNPQTVPKQCSDLALEQYTLVVNDGRRGLASLHTLNGHTHDTRYADTPWPGARGGAWVRGG